MSVGERGVSDVIQGERGKNGISLLFVGFLTLSLAPVLAQPLLAIHYRSEVRLGTSKTTYCFSSPNAPFMLVLTGCLFYASKVLSP